MGKNQMTTKQNAINLAKTARSEAAAIANGTKRTITQIITNWNECVKQAGFMCIYDFPTTGYSRKSQIADDLIRCAGQLDDYCEPNPHAPQTVEQQTREINAVLTRVLDADEAHTEALAMNEQFDYYAHPEWQRQLLAKAHREALMANTEVDRRIALSIERTNRTEFFELTDDHQKRIVNLCHTEALEIDEAINIAVLVIKAMVGHDIEAILAGVRSGLYQNGINDVCAAGRTALRIAVAEGHAEALEINDAYNTLYVYAPGDAAQDVWLHLTEVERAVSVKFAHKQALHENQQHDDAIAYFAAEGSRLCLEAFTPHQIKQIAEFCHSDALELNTSYGECA